MTTWFQQRNLFDPVNGSLTSLSTGLKAPSGSEINCYGAEAVRSVIPLDVASVEGAIVKRKNQIRTIKTLQTIISVKNTPIRVDPMVLYERLTTLIKHEHENVQQFVHEQLLTSETTSLFTDGNMRKPKKSILYWRLVLKNP